MATATRMLNYCRSGLQGDSQFTVYTLPTVTGIDIWRIIPAFAAFQMGSGYTINAFGLFLQSTGSIRLPIVGPNYGSGNPQSSAMGTMHYPCGAAVNILTNAGNQGTITELSSISGAGYPFQGADMSSYSGNWGPTSFAFSSVGRLDMVNFTYGKPGDTIVCRGAPSSNNDTWAIAFQAVLIGDGN